MKNLPLIIAASASGEIAGIGAPAGCSDDRLCGHAFLLTPCDDNPEESQEGEGCEGNAESAAAPRHSALSSKRMAAIRAESVPRFYRILAPMECLQRR